MQITHMDMIGAEAPRTSQDGINNRDENQINNDKGSLSDRSSSKESKAKRKRNRVPLSCTICRKRKVKCDKTRPHCNQCTKTGVAHLCHYMEQSWAEEAERELSKDTELKNLRERVKYLERTLNKMHASSIPTVNGTPDLRSPSDSTQTSSHVNNTIDQYDNNNNNNNTNNKNNNSNSISNRNTNDGQGTANSNDNSRSNKYNNKTPKTTTTDNGLILNPKDKYDNDELDLTKQFDMLHIKNNGTIHLGATHWLAIMKGDPYLKLLWGHIFNIREKVNGWYSQRMVLNKHSRKKTSLKHSGKCPIDSNNRPVSNGTRIPHPLHASTDNSTLKCPITGQTYDDLEKPPSAPSHPVVKKEEEPKAGIPASATDNNQASIPIAESPTRCPVTGAVSTENQPAPHPLRSPPITSSNVSNSHHKSKNQSRTRPIPYNMNPSIRHEKGQILPPIARLSAAHLKKIDYDSMSHKEIIQRVAKLLPPRHIIFQFVNKFFKHIYPIIPIIDEGNFKNHLEEILSSNVDPLTVDTSPLKIKVSKPSDYCYLGITILILRLTWLSLPANRCELKLGAFDTSNIATPGSPSSVSSTSSLSSSANIKEDNMLINYDTPVECLELVKDYLIKFDKISSVSNNNINLTTIQFAVFYKMYMSNSPTEGFVAPKKNAVHSISDSNAHDNESNQILLSSIIQMAFSCGLHRDPDNFPQLNVVSTYHNKESGTTLKEATTEVPEDGTKTNEGESKNKDNQIATERFKHTWRKIWYYIVHLDVEQSLALGSPRLLRNMKDFSDTKLPSASKIDYVRDIKELVIIKNFTLFWQIDLIIIAVLNHILNVFLAKNVRKFELDALIESLTDLTYGKKSISDIINGLVNKSLLYTSEASVSFQEYADDSYGLPSLEEILANKSVSTPSSNAATPSFTGHDPAQVSSNNNNSNVTEKKFELPHESTTKALFFTKHLTLRMILYLLNYILFTHYEPLGSQDSGTIALTKKYAQETLNFALDGYRNCLIFFSNVKKTSRSYSTIFDYSNVLLSPGCLDIGHRALQFIVCLTLRAKCGPIGGFNQNLFTNSGGEESDVDSNSEVIAPSKVAVTNLSEINPNVINDINLESVTDAQLSTNLIARMQLFEDLTRQVAVQYPYASRTSRSTGFFITLLGGHSSMKKTESNNSNGTQWKHPNISNFFKNVPSMVLSGDNDQLSRCPVFQDALGFVSPKYSATPGTTQLPPIKSAYKPITYTNSNMRKLEIKKEDQDEKRRKLNPSESVNGGVDIINKNGPNRDGTAMANANNKLVNNGVNMIPPLPIINSINNLIETMTMPNNFGMPGNMATDRNNYNIPRRNAAQFNNGVAPSPQLDVPMSQAQGRVASNSSTPIARQPDNMINNNIAMQGNNNMMSNGFAGIPNAAMLNEIAASGNSNFNELFDPSSVIQAITQFNPLLEINNLNNGANVNGYDMSVGSNTPNGMMNGPGMTGMNNPASPYGGSVTSNTSTSMYNTGTNSQRNNNINNNNNMYGAYNSNIPSNTSMNNVGTNNNSAANSPAGMPQGQMGNGMDMEFFMPRIEDGFTELQDFTIWD
ncbi:heme-responsive zinc finger transcription factor Hap1p [Monosporozyma servazzii]